MSYRLSKELITPRKAIRKLFEENPDAYRREYRSPGELKWNPIDPDDNLWCLNFEYRLIPVEDATDQYEQRIVDLENRLKNAQDIIGEKNQEIDRLAHIIFIVSEKVDKLYKTTAEISL